MDQTQVKSEENPPGTRKLAACSPEVQKHGVHKPSIHWQDLSKIEEEAGKVGNQRNIFSGCIQNQCWHGNCFQLRRWSRHPLWSGFLDESEIYTNTKFENIWSVFNITRKLIKEHSEEILNVECLENVSTVMDEINIGQWSRSQVGEGRSMCLRWFRSFVSDRWMLQEHQKDGKAKLKISRSSSYLDAEDFVIISFREIQNDLETKNIKPEDFKDPTSSLFMFNDIERKKNEIFRMPKKSGRQQNGTCDLRALVILSSKAPALRVVKSWSRGKADVPFTSMEILQIQNSCSKQFTLSVSPVSTEQCLLPASCDRQGIISNSMENSYSSVSRTFEFSILPENPSFGVSFSRRHHHWTNSGSSRCKNCWRDMA